MTGVVVRHGGYVANYLGDGILAYFGWPRADEDEAAQAIRAGLAGGRCSQELSLHAHVGIASGTVVVGDIEAAGRRQAGAIAGETPNLAARLEALGGAGPGRDRRVDPAAHRRRLHPRRSGPAGAEGHRRAGAGLAGAGRAVGREPFDARAGRLTPFIGREHELALLVDRFERARQAKARPCCCRAKPGSASRASCRCCTSDCLGAIRTRGCACNARRFTPTSALYPVFRHLEYAAGFLPDDEPEASSTSSKRCFGKPRTTWRRAWPLLAPLLSLPAAERYGSDRADRRAAQGTRYCGSSVDQLLGLGAHNPVLFILEDAHWIDPATREFIDHMLARIADARVLMVITHRPEFQSDWTRHPHVTALTLNRLSRGQGIEVVRAAGGAALSEEIVARICGAPTACRCLSRS